MKLKTRLTLTFVTLTSFFVILVSVIGFINFSSTLKSTIINQMNGQLNTFTTDFDGWLNNKRTVVETTGSIIKEYINKDDLSMKGFLQSFQSDPDIYDIYLGVAEDGSIIDGGDWIADEDYDARKRIWYTSAVEKDALTFSLTPADEATDWKNAFSYSMPIKDSNKNLKYVLSGDINLITLNKLVSDLNVDEAGFSFVIDDNGVIIAHSANEEYLSKNIDSVEELASLKETLLFNESDYTEYTFNGVNKIIVYNKLKTTGWHVAFVIPESIMYKSLKSLTWLYIIIIIVAIIILLFITNILAKKIVNPICKLTDAATLISNGDLNVNALVNSKDEIGTLATTFNNMGSSFRTLVSNIIKSTLQVKTAANEFSSVYQQNATASEEIGYSIESISDSATKQSQLSENGLNITNTLSTMIENNLENINELNKSSESVNTLVTAGLDVVSNLTKVASDNQESIHNVHQVILKTDESSDQIANASSVISSIAEQTNLLALNAAIEAARAGESGKGFAVVADEIRKLAEQSASSTKEIDFAVTNLKQHSSTSVTTIEKVLSMIDEENTCVNKTSEHYNTILNSTSEMIKAITSLTYSSKLMQTEKDNIIGIITELASIAEENAAATQQASAMTEEQIASLAESKNQIDTLLNMSDELEESVKKFKI